MTSQESINMDSPVGSNSDDSNLSELAAFFAATFSPAVVNDEGEGPQEREADVEEVEIGLEPYMFERVRLRVRQCQ